MRVKLVEIKVQKILCPNKHWPQLTLQCLYQLLFLSLCFVRPHVPRDEETVPQGW